MGVLGHIIIKLIGFGCFYMAALIGRGKKGENRMDKGILKGIANKFYIMAGLSLISLFLMSSCASNNENPTIEQQILDVMN
jgi:hypothetical protein